MLVVLLVVVGGLVVVVVVVGPTVNCAALLFQSSKVPQPTVKMPSLTV